MAIARGECRDRALKILRLAPVVDRPEPRCTARGVALGYQRGHVRADHAGADLLHGDPGCGAPHRE
jgi:sugar phosphate isomerase/epimerase